jgi:hypothetical protein
LISEWGNARLTGIIIAKLVFEVLTPWMPLLDLRYGRSLLTSRTNRAM